MGRIPPLPRPRRPKQITRRQPHSDRTGGHPRGTDRVNHYHEESHDDVVHHVPGLDLEMTTGNWADPAARSVALFIDGAHDPDVTALGDAVVDDDFLILVNSWWEPL